jgi:hypothetical protein
MDELRVAFILLPTMSAEFIWRLNIVITPKRNKFCAFNGMVRA